MIKENFDNNGYDYVDLGLPSGTLWATINVGASKPSDAGLYFQWGDTKGYTIDQVGKDKQFTWDDYKFRINKNSSKTNEQFVKDLQFNLSDSKSIITEGASKFSKYRERGAKLELEDDAAHINMGGDWHMPTLEQISELINETVSEWVTLDDAKGMKFTSKKDKSKSIFIPATGYAWGCSVDYSGSYGYILSSVLGMDTVYGSQFLIFHSEGAYLSDAGYRSDGLSVRGVIDGKQNDTKDKKENTIMDKENKAMIDRHNSLKAFDDEIESLQEKIKEIKKKKDACLTDDYSKMYTGKYVRITRKGFPYIKECIYVRSVYTDMDSDKFALKLQGQGFRYIAGDYLDEIEGNFSEIYSTTIFEN